jgi:hypothetical protein
VQLVEPVRGNGLHDDSGSLLAKQNVIVLVGTELELLDGEMRTRGSLRVELADDVAGLRVVPEIVPLDVDDVGIFWRIHLMRPDQLTRTDDRSALRIPPQWGQRLVEGIAKKSCLIELIRQRAQTPGKSIGAPMGNLTGRSSSSQTRAPS